MLSPEPEPFRALARTLWAAPEGGHASRAALRAAREAAANPFAVREFLAVFRAEAVGDTFGLGTARLRARPVPPPVTVFLLEPVGADRPGEREGGVRLPSHGWEWFATPTA